MAPSRTLFGRPLTRWSLSILGLVCLLSAIWFVGPLIAFAGTEPLAAINVRLIAMLIVVVLWALNNGGFRLLVRLIGPRLELILKTVAGVAGVLMIIVWTISYWHNKNYVDEMVDSILEYEKRTAELAESSGSIVEVLRPLDTLRTFPGGYDDRGVSRPWWAGFGFPQGEELGVAARRAYRRTLNAVIMPRLLERLEAQISEFASSRGGLYEALKVYLMLGNPRLLDRDFALTWITLDWEAQLSGQANLQVRDHLHAHFKALLDGETVPPLLDAALISQARQVLARQPLADRIYQQLKQTAEISGPKPWRLTDRLEDAGRLFRRKSGEPLNAGIPGLFTNAGLYEVFLVNLPELAGLASREAWVMGPGYGQQIEADELPSLIERVTELYTREYKRQWEALLADVTIVSFASRSEAVEVLNALSKPVTPIEVFLKAVVEQTQPGKVSSESESRSIRLESVRNRLAALLGSSGADQPDVELQDSFAEVNRVFAPLRAAVESEPGSPPPIAGALSTLARVAQQLSTIGGQDGDQPTPELEAAIGSLSQEARRQPQPLSDWLTSLHAELSQLVVASRLAQLNHVWRSDVAYFCRLALEGRYPLVRSSPRDAKLSDFARYFGPRGTAEAFFEQHLSPYVDTSVRPWRERPADGPSLVLSSPTLRHFERAFQIREAFFPGRSTEPTVSFSIRPIRLDTGARSVLLEFGDQRLAYRHGPLRPLTMQWPPPGGALRAKIEITPVLPFGQKQKALSAKGPWSLFRLLDKGRVEKVAQNDRFTVRFKLGSLSASFEIRASSVVNPFFLSALGNYRCLERL